MIRKLTIQDKHFCSALRHNQLAAAIIAALTLYSATAVADAASAEPRMEQVIVSAHGDDKRINATGDAASLLKKQAGVNFYSAGGVSSLPVIRGLNDDRIKLLVDGAESTSACANHMNPALSYIDASRISDVEVIAGITPVSKGGDSIAGTIAVNSLAPVYAQAGEGLHQEGSLGFFYKSNSKNSGSAVSAALASERFSLGYAGSLDKADSYRDGNGDKVLDTLYKSENHALTLGVNGDNQELIVKLSRQEIPYQGFVNQYMDMVGNTSDAININYLREFAWGRLDTRLTWQDVDHEMGFFSREKPGVMPMITEGRDLGYAIKANIPLSASHTLRLGHEYRSFTLDDYWPAVPGSAMMGPQDYININDGERDRIALYAESEYRVNDQWSTLVGLRTEWVRTDTGDVSPYNPGMMSMMPGSGMSMPATTMPATTMPATTMPATTMPAIPMPAMGSAMTNPDAAAAIAFNSRAHQRRDENIDLTLLARYAPADNSQYEFGYARKTRSPNIYERYSWGRGTMAMTMVGWFGDGNAYVGDIDLDPEVAHTLSASVTLRGAGTNAWQFTATPYVTYVEDYIDAIQIGTFNPRNAMQVVRPKLQFANSDARFYGIDLFLDKTLWQNSRWGSGQLKGFAGYTRGERSGSGGDLYQIMPLNMRASVEQSINSWTNSVELEWVASKTRVDDIRSELATDSYALLGVSTAYQWKKMVVTLAVSNLLDEDYDLPLGGVNLAGWLAEGNVGQFEAVPGRGRSFDIGVNFSF